jgi:hypothetical protein
MWGHVALGSCLNAGHPPAPTLHLGFASVLSTPQRTHDTWAALGVSMPALHLGMPGTWVWPVDPRGMDPA